MTRIIVSIIGIVVGAIFVIKSEWFLKNFGKNAWAEKHMGAEGGSRLMYKLIGLAIILISLLLMTNMLGGIIIGILEPVFSES